MYTLTAAPTGCVEIVLPNFYEVMKKSKKYY